MADEEHAIRQRAIKRLEAKREFYGHAVVYVAVNTLLVVIWAVTSRPGYFWPIWPMLGWGIGLAFHAWSTFGQRPISEAEIRREMEREARRLNGTGT